MRRLERRTARVVLADIERACKAARAIGPEILVHNAAGILLTLQAVARRMIAHGRGGRIIDMASQADRRGEAPVAAAVPMGRMARPEDLTGVATFLASLESDCVVGQTWNVDGGNVLS